MNDLRKEEEEKQLDNKITKTEKWQRDSDSCQAWTSQHVWEITFTCHLWVDNLNKNVCIFIHRV